MGPKILLTGEPSSGKTTLVKRVLKGWSQPAGGFVTQEVRLGGVRQGFEIETLDGQRGLLAHADLPGPLRVGRYGVDLRALEALGAAAVRRAIANQALVVIDEIGPMELFSPLFQQVVLEALASPAPLLGTIVKRSVPFADRVKKMPGVKLVEVTPGNWEERLDEILEWLLGKSDPAPRSG